MGQEIEFAQNAFISDFSVLLDQRRVILVWHYNKLAVLDYPIILLLCLLFYHTRILI